MAWERRKSGPKSAKNQSFSLVSTIILSFLSLSLSIVAFGHHHSNHRRFVTVSTTSGRLNSSPAAKHTSQIPLSLLQIFFSFFLLALPPATCSNYRPHHHTSSSTARPPPRQVAFFSSLSSSSSSSPLSLLIAWTINVNFYCSRMNNGRELYNSRPLFMQWTIFILKKYKFF